MFFCDECAVKKSWPQSVNLVKHVCEVCGKEAQCNEVPNEKLNISPTAHPHPDGKTWTENLSKQFQRKIDGSRIFMPFGGTPAGFPPGFSMPPIRDKDLEDLLRAAIRGSGMFVGSFDSPEEAMQACQDIMRIVQASESPEEAMQQVAAYIQALHRGGKPSGAGSGGSESGDPYGGRYV
jgi:hypothetical protein